MIKHFSLWTNEIEYIQHLIDIDVRNNSAWNQRFFILSHELASTSSSAAKADILSREIDYTLGKIALCLDNESSWNYLRALTSRWTELEQADGAYPPNVVDFCMSRFKGSVDDKEDESSPFLMAFIVEYNHSLCKSALKNDDSSSNLSNENKIKIAQLVKSSIEILESLANRYDTIRVNYWNYMVAKWKQEFKQFI